MCKLIALSSLFSITTLSCSRRRVLLHNTSAAAHVHAYICNRSFSKVCRSLSIPAGGDELPDDINKLKTKVRRLYDIANVLTTLNLISKVHIPPSRRPAFVWLGIEGIAIQQQAATQQPASTASLAAAKASHSEAASSTATGSSVHDHTHLRHLSSGTLNTSSMTQADSQSTSSKGLKRGALLPLQSSSSQKCARTAAPRPSNIMYGTVTSPQRLAPSASFCDEEANREDAGGDISDGSAEPGCSTTMGQHPEAGVPGKPGLRPTPVPITPEGGQPDAGQQRHGVS